VRYCLFVNDGVTPNDEPYGGDYVSGIDAMWLKDWVIADNTFVNIRGQHGGGRGAIFVWVNSENVVVERNLIVNCDRGICFGNPSGDPLHMTRGIVRNNFIVAGLGQGIEICRTRDTAVLHNTIFCERPGQRTVQFHQLAGAGNRFLNNLVSGSLMLPDEVTVAGNVTGALAEWFVAPRVGDLRLTPKAARGNPAAAGAHER
jgi:nitrous oxidase accessory protein NosD